MFNGNDAYGEMGILRMNLGDTVNQESEDSRNRGSSCL